MGGLKNFFLDNINFCHGTLSNGEPKPDNRLVDMFFLLFWPLFRDDDGCRCCIAVRGVLIGFAAGLALGLVV